MLFENGLGDATGVLAVLSTMMLGIGFIAIGVAAKVESKRRWQIRTGLRPCYLCSAQGGQGQTSRGKPNQTYNSPNRKPTPV